MTTTQQRTRTLVALNGDVVGYSRLMADDPDATSQSMGAAQQLVDRAVTERDGAVVNFVGDNFMAVFDTAVDGVQAAIDIATALEDANADLPSTRHLRFRMGMDVGDVSIVDDRYEGDALNIAARIQAIARPGGLGVSGRIYRTLDEPALRFRPRGPQHLKGIPEAVDVYDFADLPSDGPGPSQGGALSLETPTVAVLPSHTEGVDDRAGSAAAMFRSDLIHRLATIPGLHVIDASDRHAGDDEHAARYMLETGIHQFGETVRLYAQLIDVTTMNVVKAHKADATIDGFLDVADGIVDDVGQSVEVELVVGAPAGLYAELGDPESIEDIYQGWFHLKSGTREGWLRSLDLFGRVSDRHPDHPYGHVLSAFANWAGAANTWTSDPEATLALAREQAHRGSALADPTGMAQAVDAAVLMSMGRLDEATEALDNVEIVRPTCDVTFGLEGSLHRYLGEWEQAIERLDTAMRLTGVNRPWYATVKSCSLFIGDRLEQSAALAESVLEYQPDDIEALLVLAAVQVELGLERRARATADRLREQHPTLDVEEWLEQNPYVDHTIIDRWKADLAQVGLVASDR